uniref:Uncharacterized protein n=1 Tax=Rhizophora mucronata TaxID=61149 RepID=A0A2P2NXR1_RHIMU
MSLKRLPEPQRPSGIFPVRKLVDRSSTVRLFCFPRPFGISPEK